MPSEGSDSESTRFVERIQQVQRGPLELTVPTSLTLRQKGRRNALQPPRLAKFKGSLNITNKGNCLVTFKVMSKHSKTLQVNPTHGLIESKQSISLKVFTKDATWLANRVTNFGLAIVATTCEVTDLSSLPWEIPLFWKKLFQDGSCAFVETFKIDDFRFVDINANALEVHSVNNLNDYSDTDANASSSSYSSQRSGTDSEDGDADPYAVRVARLGNRRKLCDTTVEEMNEITENMEATYETMKYWSGFLILFTIISCLTCLQRILGGLELEIGLTQRKS